MWVDEDELQVGDPVSQSIDAGLRSCRFVVAVLSPAFFAKPWPRRELEGVVAKESTENRKILLPVWHQLNQAQITQLHQP